MYQIRCCVLVMSNLLFAVAVADIDRLDVVRRFNPKRTTSMSTPLQVGNGDFAFGADITGLQTFQPFNTLSSWGWHNDSLPNIIGQQSPDDYIQPEWWTHGKLVPYAQPNPAQPALSQWLIANPHRINLARIGLFFADGSEMESSIADASQELDLTTGHLQSNFTYGAFPIAVETVVDPLSSTIGVRISSDLLGIGRLGVFIDFPYASGANKFDAPFVGVWNATQKHQTELLSTKSASQAVIRHVLDATTYYTDISWSGSFAVNGPIASTHRYIVKTQGNDSVLDFTASFSTELPSLNSTGGPTFSTISNLSSTWWSSYWNNGAFVDLTSTTGVGAHNATELQRRTILSQYLLAVNGAGHDPTQESGLTNNGWYGKFHAEMFHWHLGHWQRWGKWDLFNRSMPGVYQRFLETSLQRASGQGYKGARWGKMSDPSGRSAPGEFNSLLIWQQPHPFMFAETEYREFPTNQTLLKWDDILVHSADFMASYAFWNESTNAYDLGPPMHVVSETTNPNATTNPTFELAYWKFGLDIAAKWQQRQGKPVPEAWQHVAQHLAPLPVDAGTYPIYEGVPAMWTTSSLTEDHPAMLGIYGWLPPPASLNMTILQNTVAKVYETWNFPYSFGWDFPLLAMNAARMGDSQKAVEFLLHPSFGFDDAGYPIGGTRVPTPYFPGSSSLLLAVAMLAGGWDGVKGPAFPPGWQVTVERFSPAL